MSSLCFIAVELWYCGANWEIQWEGKFYCSDDKEKILYYFDIIFVSLTIFSPNPTANDREQEEPSTLNTQNDDPETSKQCLYLLQVID